MQQYRACIGLQHAGAAARPDDGHVQLGQRANNTKACSLAFDMPCIE
jgi:hypothetical protein